MSCPGRTLLIGQSDRSPTASDWSRRSSNSSDWSMRFFRPKLLIGRGDRPTLLIGQSDRSPTASDWLRRSSNSSDWLMRFFCPKLLIGPASCSLNSSDWSMCFCLSSPREVRQKRIDQSEESSEQDAGQLKRSNQSSRVHPEAMARFSINQIHQMENPQDRMVRIVSANHII